MSEHMTAERMERMHLSVDDYMTRELRAAIAKAVAFIDALGMDVPDEDGDCIRLLDAITEYDMGLLRSAGAGMRP